MSGDAESRDAARESAHDSIQDSTIRGVLEASGLPYEIMPCDPALADTVVFCERYGIPLGKSVNTILVKAKTGGVHFAACVLLANTRLDVNKVVRKRLGARRVSFASADETREITGMEIGGVTPVGLPADLPLWVDRRVMEPDFVILGGGNRHSKIKIAPDVFSMIPNCTVIEGLARDAE
ncbi:MAG: YbaK/EbsC family protein [Burkholderiales bacterium]|nr:YbaK/EbsC family protein [Burkholderiales bacterium]